jgi:hypothetical protein
VGIFYIQETSISRFCVARGQFKYKENYFLGYEIHKIEQKNTESKDNTASQTLLTSPKRNKEP